MTPEGKVKRLIDKYLFTLHSISSVVRLYHEKPVPTGFGKSGLDYTCSINGRFVAIEAKAPGEWLTPRQRKTALAILKSGGKVFVISGPQGLAALQRWVASLAFDPANTVANPFQWFPPLPDAPSDASSTRS